ncbi:MAG: phosphoribosylamine--glycine ligase [Geodermatophilaceae bacterium]
MRVLIIGSGGREHALCVALAADHDVTALSCAPGNAGTIAIAPPPETADSIRLQVDSPEQVAALAQGWAADLVIIGPEGPLVAGTADAVRAAGIACFGPSKEAAALEGSKTFAKEVMRAAGVPTADAVTVTSVADLEDALDRFGAPHVVKDDGLAAGKGVVVTSDRAAARAHAHAILAAGHSVVVEDYLDGPEVSLFAVTDGITVVPLQPAQDFKRIGDGDTGLNTGGMGAYAPLPWAPTNLVTDVMASVLQPTVDELRRRGTPFAGLLYAGLALTSSGVRVVEFNARFGDPETQVVLPLLATSLAWLLHAAATGRLADHEPLQWHSGAAVTVVVAAPGYPDNPRTGQVVSGADGPDVRHAGTTRGADGQVRVTGGRVLSVVGTGPDLAAARTAAYDSLSPIVLDGAQYRRDIASAAVEGRITVP